jgi:hypothetical protein
MSAVSDNDYHAEGGKLAALASPLPSLYDYHSRSEIN